MCFPFFARRLSFLFFVCCIFGAQKSFSQPQPVPVPGLPTKEIFDLLVDKRGFLWVGHEMGISRLDGLSFTHFSHPERSSLSVTDLVEDSFGRIWFHNFTGQVFYIENEKMHLLEAYENEQENYFPALCSLEMRSLFPATKACLFVIPER